MFRENQTFRLYLWRNANKQICKHRNNFILKYVKCKFDGLIPYAEFRGNLIEIIKFNRWNKPIIQFLWWTFIFKTIFRIIVYILYWLYPWNQLNCKNLLVCFKKYCGLLIVCTKWWRYITTQTTNCDFLLDGT